eukprot:PITA_24127
MDSIRLALAIAAAQGWEVHQMDLKNAFFYGDLSEDIYMEQPHGFIQDSFLVYRLKKSLYGLKQALRAWYAKTDSFLLSQNFERCKFDANVYMLRTHDSLLILVLYVDNLLITGSFASAIAAVKRALHDTFLMTDMGPLHFFLGLEISENATGIKLSQAKYAWDLLERFHMPDCKLAPTPFLFGVRLADGGDSIDHKSTSEYSLSLGSSPIYWLTKKYTAIALSAAEAKYKGVVNITIQALWLQHFLIELDVQFHQPIFIWCDNESILKFCMDPAQWQ